jgi:hypothetical protein
MTSPTINVCICGCGKGITIKNYHKYYGIPKFILGHNRKGIIPSQETKDKIRNKMKANKPHPNCHSEYANKLRSESLLGHRGYWLGKNFSKKHRNKISLANSGKKSYRWKGGISKLNNKIRNCAKSVEWRTKIYKRDNFKCQICGKNGGKLNADHIKSFALILKENKINSLKQAKMCKELWDINNGRTLCFLCHTKTVSYRNTHIC